ncbi:hypothetical protein GCM10028792_15450 [Salinisphaera aquimarina]
MLVALIIAFVAATALMDSEGVLAFARWTQHPWRVVFNAVPGLLCVLFLLAMTRRALLSFVLVLLVEALLYGINALKVANLGTPLLPADFYMLGQLSHGIAELLGGYLPRSIWPYLSIAGVFVFLGCLARYEPPLLRRRTGGRRVFVAGVSSALLVALLVGTWPWPQAYEFQRVRMQPWAPASTAGDMGLVNTLVLFHLYFGVHNQKPDADVARRLVAQEEPALTQYMQASSGADTRPDIVVIQSESFFDPVIMNGYENAGFNPNLHRLARQGTSGYMQVPTFGGGTIRTEFEVLTGMPLRYLDGVQFPYLQINQPVIPSLVRTLGDAGYRTTAVHGADPAVWDRARAFRSIGFERFLSIADFPADAPTDGRYMADSAMTDEILEQLDDQGPPQFLFAISIEAHGSYDVSPGADPEVRDAIPVPASVTDPAARLKLRNFIYHMRHADAELGRLVAALQKRSRPTLVVFYGDHLPGLLDAYRQTGFVNGRDHQAQKVPWLMVDTHSVKKPRRQDTSAWLLPGIILDRVGIRDAEYFALTRLVGPSLMASLDATATPRNAESDERRDLLDRGMANLTKLRLRGDSDTLAVTVGEHDAADRGLAGHNRTRLRGMIRYGVAP